MTSRVSPLVNVCNVTFVSQALSPFAVILSHLHLSLISSEFCLRCNFGVCLTVIFIFLKSSTKRTPLSRSCLFSAYVEFPVDFGLPRLSFQSSNVCAELLLLLCVDEQTLDGHCYHCCYHLEPETLQYNCFGSWAE